GKAGLGRLSRHDRGLAAEIVAPAVAVFHGVIEALGVFRGQLTYCTWRAGQSAASILGNWLRGRLPRRLWLSPSAEFLAVLPSARPAKEGADQACWCPDSEVRIILRRPRLRTSESKDTSSLLI